MLAGAMGDPWLIWRAARYNNYPSIVILIIILDGLIVMIE